MSSDVAKKQQRGLDFYCIEWWSNEQDLVRFELVTWIRRRFMTRMKSPVSRGSFAIRFSTFDVIWALISPLLALWIRNATVLSLSSWETVAFYCTIAFVSSLFAFLVFRTRDGMTHLFSVNDALEVAKAVLLSEFLTCLALFSLTRLDGIPRSTPLIHALLLFAGLVSARAFIRTVQSENDLPAPTTQLKVEHVIVIGSNKLSALYIDFLRAYAPNWNRVIGVLDERAEMIGRSIAGVRVLGHTIDLLPIVNEFKEHGIHTDRIIVGGDRDFFTKEAVAEITRVCNEHEIELDYVPELVGLNTLRATIPQNQAEREESNRIAFSPSSYFRVKHYVDFCLSLLLIVFLLPVFLIIAAVALLDVGSPIFFWQRRVGVNGQGFHVHKFRTLRPGYDDQRKPFSTTDRVSWIGALLRRSRLDELPQLLNVLVGDMSLIGPRPLLPHDQPSDSTLRLLVRPGMTGWAQVNGGKLITPEEKNALDEWYVRNASFWLDVKIIGKTIVFMLSGESRHAQTATTQSTTIVAPVQPAE
jgi:lipopolysaccharide/colanic/teichoic acid biosynthesis glycosyltransferase